MTEKTYAWAMGILATLVMALAILAAKFGPAYTPAVSSPAAGPTGRIAGFDPAREGSTPSPAATPVFDGPYEEPGLIIYQTGGQQATRITFAELERIGVCRESGLRARRRGYQEGEREGFEYGYRQAREDALESGMVGWR